MKKIISFITALTVLISVLFNISISASEVTDADFSYCRSGVWSNFSGKTVFSDYMDCIRIQTDPNKDYYLSYKTWNEGKDGYYSAVQSNKSGSEEYAGATGRRIRNLSISVYDKSGNSVKSGIVVMYRALVDGVWLPWVSNADPEWMSYVQRKYKLDGVLDTASGNAGINSSYISGVEIRIFEESSIDDSKGTAGKSKLINAPFISQVGSYPTGCESVSTVMALQHSGLNISVDDFIDSYLEKGSANSFDPNICFGGDPKSTSGMGCYSPVIAKAAKKALIGKRTTVKLVSGLSLKELCEEYIDRGVPVIVWATIDMQKAATGKKITYEDRIIQWISPEHCLLLVGYDEDNYIFNDPQKSAAATYYTRNASENAYCALGCQAVVIETLPETADSEYSEYAVSDKVETVPCADIYNGAYKTEITPLEMPDGRKIKFTAFYNSSIQADGSMGIGWYHSFENHLEKSGDNILIYESPTVYGVYEQQENGKYSCTSIGLDGYCLTKTEDGYILDRNLNGTEHYDNTGRLIKIYDKYGYGISLTHGENYIRVTDDLTDKGFNIELENGRITAITDDYGRNVSFNYTGDMLTKILDTEGNSKTYEYDIYGKILTSSDTVNSYDSEGRIVSAVFENESYSFSYNGSTVTVNNAVYTFGEEGQLTDFTEQNGNTYSYIYDEKGNIITESSKEGSISYTYHSFSRPEKAVYSNGSAVSFIYDENGNLLEKIYPLNGDANRDGTADIMDIVRMKKYIAEIENTEIDIFNSDYNSDGINSMDLTYLRRLLLFSDRASLRAKEEYVYNERNQLILYCDKSGTETTYSYDSNGFSTE